MRSPPTRLLSTNRAWPAPAGDHSTRQWLHRVDAVWPLSLLKRTNEFSPIRISSCGLICSSMTVLLGVNHSFGCGKDNGETIHLRGPFATTDLLAEDFMAASGRRGVTAFPSIGR